MFRKFLDQACVGGSMLWSEEVAKFLQNPLSHAFKLVGDIFTPLVLSCNCFSFHTSLVVLTLLCASFHLLTLHDWRPGTNFSFLPILSSLCSQLLWFFCYPIAFVSNCCYLISWLSRWLHWVFQVHQMKQLESIWMALRNWCRQFPASATFFFVVNFDELRKKVWRVFWFWFVLFLCIYTKYVYVSIY